MHSFEFTRLSPEQLDQRIIDRLQRLTRFSTWEEVFGYFNYTQKRLGALTDSTRRGAIDTRMLMFDSYAESLVLKKAIFGAEFYTKSIL